MQTNSITLPPIELLAAAADELANEAQQAGERAHMNALNKAMLQLHEGTAPVPTISGWLLKSRTRPGIVHRISVSYGCSCEAGANGKACWHKQLMCIVERAAHQFTMPDLTQQQAQEAVDELFAY